MFVIANNKMEEQDLHKIFEEDFGSDFGQKLSINPNLAPNAEISVDDMDTPNSFKTESASHQQQNQQQQKHGANQNQNLNHQQQHNFHLGNLVANNGSTSGTSGSNTNFSSLPVTPFTSMLQHSFMYPNLSTPQTPGGFLPLTGFNLNLNPSLLNTGRLLTTEELLNFSFTPTPTGQGNANALNTNFNLLPMSANFSNHLLTQQALQGLGMANQHQQNGQQQNVKSEQSTNEEQPATVSKTPRSRKKQSHVQPPSQSQQGGLDTLANTAVNSAKAKDSVIKQSKRRKSTSSAAKVSSNSKIVDNDENRWKSWGRDEEVFLVGAVMDRFFKRGSLSSTKLDEKAKDDCWSAIKVNYDKAWNNYQIITGKTIPPERSINALSRHYKVMKARISQADMNGEECEDFRVYYDEWEQLYNIDNRLLPITGRPAAQYAHGQVGVKCKSGDRDGEQEEVFRKRKVRASAHQDDDGRETSVRNYDDESASGSSNASNDDM